MMNILLFKDLFIHDKNQLYSVQLENGKGYICQKSNNGSYIFFNDDVLKDHISGRITASVQPIQYETNNVKFIAFDIDVMNMQIVNSMVNRLKNLGLHPYIEFSGRKGYHVFLFLNSVLPAKAAKDFAYFFVKDNSFNTDVEVFPAGNFVSERYYPHALKLPLGIHRGSGKRSFFIENNQPIKDIDKFMNGIKKLMLLKYLNLAILLEKSIMVSALLTKKVFLLTGLF